ncbi:response regulator receiver protein [Desulfarculus baarsii DSM 2075]|uniref:Response regulator receiver protein n=1 Tax=Desulfarculus baarsii (strain ATCC 33931 / DSM 2075 / LMG 7858 / VKM B-1802 / 2st14) TaxID=644282 RepID=E1QDC2_DESB2|nr:response regulator receiver protein [Desulfarculus baarsii]ADK83441.1 response regulator receiver protein [Desulfarculus baarsii DSM 2075]
MNSDHEIRVMLLDRGQYVGQWLGRLLGRTPGFSYLGHCDGGRCLESRALRTRPDVVLMDLQTARALPGGAMGRLRQSLPGAMFVLMDLDDGGNYERLARRLGADGFISSANMPQALEKIRRRLLYQRRV